MKITDNIFINWNNPTQEFTLGIHNERTLFFNGPEDEIPENPDEFSQGYRLIIGFLFFSLTIIYE